jgi:predicted transcriptional regulator
MQQMNVHKSIYKLNQWSVPEEELHPERFDPKLLELKRKVQQWISLKERQVPDQEISEIIGFSRASFYRHKKALERFGLRGLERRSKRPKQIRMSTVPEATVNLILDIRKENPTYGKFKLTVILKRDHGGTISESSVGRILKKLRDQGLITRSVSAGMVKRKRNFKGHAQPWRYELTENTVPGEMIQIDHMTVTKHNVSMKEFRAWDPTTKMVVADVTSNATSAAAAKFLRKIIQEYPFKVLSIQVDGGSEFMKHFEEACKELDIELFVLPPARPQYNGGVERANRISREEIYQRNDIQAESISEFRAYLQQEIHKYNTYRPHFSLNGLTPLEYTNLILAA